MITFGNWSMYYHKYNKNNLFKKLEITNDLKLCTTEQDT